MALFKPSFKPKVRGMFSKKFKLPQTNIQPEAEFKEFEARLKFKPRLKYGSQLKPVFGGFETRLKFIEFGHWIML